MDKNDARDDNVHAKLTHTHTHAHTHTRTCTHAHAHAHTHTHTHNTTDTHADARSSQHTTYMLPAWFMLACIPLGVFCWMCRGNSVFLNMRSNFEWLAPAHQEHPRMLRSPRTCNFDDCMHAATVSNSQMQTVPGQRTHRQALLPCTRTHAYIHRPLDMCEEKLNSRYVWLSLAWDSGLSLPGCWGSGLSLCGSGYVDHDRYAAGRRRHLSDAQ